MFPGVVEALRGGGRVGHFGAFLLYCAKEGAQASVLALPFGALVGVDVSSGLCRRRELLLRLAGKNLLCLSAAHCHPSTQDLLPCLLVAVLTCRVLVAPSLPVLLPLSTTLRLGGYPFVGNSEMAPFFWLAPGGANFLLCLLLRRHCCSAYLLSRTQEVLFWPCLSVRSTPFTCLERAQRREIALVA
jgi:hypothetical protein